MRVNQHNIYCTGMGVTCVSLKSLTPTQYTIAPRDLAVSACWKKEGINILLPENWSWNCSSLGNPPQCEAATSCCAVMSWCSCSSPSVSAMITLAVPGGITQTCYNLNIIHNLTGSCHTDGLFDAHQSSPAVSARLPTNERTFSWSDCQEIPKVSHLNWSFTFDLLFATKTVWFSVSNNIKKHCDKGVPSVIQGAWTCLHQESLFSEHSAPFWCPLCREER